MLANKEFLIISESCCLICGLKLRIVTNLVIAKGLNERVSLFKSSIHEQGNSDSQTSKDLLVLRLLSVGNHVLNGGLGL